jgi:hypothetical protein
MIKVAGTLSIKHVHGSRGIFAVGDLVTDVGEFKIKDPILDQFEEGKYHGQFLIAKISPSSYFFGGKVVIEVRALLADIFLDTAVEAPAEPTPVEPDPSDESVTGSELGQVSTDSSSTLALPLATAPIEGEFATDAERVDYDLLGHELYPAFATRAPMRLQPEVGREQFTRQRLRLKEVGYVFDPLTKTWRCPAKVDTTQ